MAGLMRRLSRPQAHDLTGLRMVYDDDMKLLLQSSGGGGMSTAGIWVSEDDALKLGAVYACVRVVSEDSAKLPLDLFRRLPGGGKEKATDHPRHRLMRRPNAVQTGYEWREMMQAHLELRGNAYCFITRYNGDIRELIPISPDLVKVEKDPYLFKIWYTIAGKRYEPEQILHLRGWTRDGYTGVTPITLHRETIGHGLATQQHGARFFRQGARASGVASHPGVLDDGAYDRLRESIESGIAGENVFRVLLLEEGMEWKQLQITNEDAQFIETMLDNRYQVAGIWRVAPHKIGLLDKATFSNIEAQERAYVQDTLDPRLTRFEERLAAALLTPAEQDEYFFEVNRDALLKGLTKERYEALQYALRNGIISRNEWRGKENWNPIPGGDRRYISRDLVAVDDEGMPLPLPNAALDGAGVPG